MASLGLTSRPRHARSILIGPENLLGGLFGIDLVDDAFKDTVFAEDEGLAKRTGAGLAAELLLTPCAKSLEE